MNNAIKHAGQYEITAIYKDGTSDTQIINNTITNRALYEMASHLSGRAGIEPLKIKYIALGGDGSAVSASQTRLGNERYRAPVIVASATSTGRSLTRFQIPESEATFTIREIGIFIGNATAELNSGIMLSRILYYRIKTNLESLQILRRDDFLPSTDSIDEEVFDNGIR